VNTNKKHTNDVLPWKQELLHSQLEIPYAQTKEDIWNRLENSLQDIPDTGKIENRHISPVFYIAIAATLLLLISIGTFVRFYKISYICIPGKTLTVSLPDGSQVILNADSRLSYYPLRWKFSRELQLKGEAWFSVTKGKSFTVRSQRGITSVIGTTFNIYARDDVYKVNCFTGKVKVQSNTTKEQIILNPDDEAEIGPNGQITYRRQVQAEAVSSWRYGLFIFTATPLEKVIRELERRYNVHIELKIKNKALYTGSFPANLNISDALDLVCKPFGLNHILKPDGSFVIK